MCQCLESIVRQQIYMLKINYLTKQCKIQLFNNCPIYILFLDNFIRMTSLTTKSLLHYWSTKQEERKYFTHVSVIN